MRIRKRRYQPPPLEPVAGNGLLDRRALLGRGIVLAGAMTTAVGTSPTSAAAEQCAAVEQAIACHGFQRRRLVATFANSHGSSP